MKQHSGHDRALADAKRLDDRLRRGVVLSVGLHGLMLAGALVTPGLFPTLGDSLWGSPDAIGGIRIGLASEVGGIPLPAPSVVSETAAGNDSEGFFEAEPPPPAPAEDASETLVEAEPIPADPAAVAEAAPPPAPPPPPAPAPEPEAPPTPNPPAPSRPVPDREPPPDRPDNAVPFGQGGQVALPFGQPGAGAGTGVAFGDGAFGDRYGAYVESIRTRISNEWLQGRIDASVRSAPRVYVSFDIERDGSISNVRIEESSGNGQVDRSARRAVDASNPLSPLPRDYRGARVSVRFWFELRR